MAPSWIVIGGLATNGILVREGKETNSTQASERLATGALVEELEKDGNRLRYRLVEGSGPREGWVSVQLPGKDGKVLLEPMSGSAPSAASAAPPAAPAPSGPYSWQRSLDRFKAHDLDKLIQEYRTWLRGHVQGPPGDDYPLPRTGGMGTHWEGWTGIADNPEGKIVLTLTGDSITHGPPRVTNTAAWAGAVAHRNSTVFVKNAGWGGIMSFSLLDPPKFGVGVPEAFMPRPADLGGDYVCVLVGTNDAMAIAGTEEFTASAWGSRPAGAGGPVCLPSDWRTSCRPSVELYEESMAALVRQYYTAGAKRVALATVPLLGEEWNAEKFSPNPKQKLDKSPYLVCRDLADAVKRVAEKEQCDVLPTFECMVHGCATELTRTPHKWTPNTFNSRMASTFFQQDDFQKKNDGRMMPWEDIGPDGTRPLYCSDLVHFNEYGGALHAALVQEWLDAQLTT